MIFPNSKIGDIPELEAFIPKTPATRITVASISVLSVVAGLKLGFGAKSFLLPLLVITALWFLVRHATRELRAGYLLDQPHQSDSKHVINGKINFPLTKLVKDSGIDTIVTETRSEQFYIFLIANNDPRKVKSLLPKISMAINVDERNLRFIQNYSEGKSALLAPLEMHKWKAVKFDKSQLIPGKLIGYVGKDVAGNHVTYDRNIEPHIGIFGDTNSGKTEMTRADIHSMKLSGLNPKIFILDPKDDMTDVDCNYYTSDIGEGVSKLEELDKLSEARKKKYSDADCKNYFEYQRKVDKTERPWIVYIDETSDFLVPDLTEDIEKGEHPIHKRAHSILFKISRKHRASGLFLSIIIQKPKAKTLPTEIRDNLGARIVLSVADKDASNLAVGQKDAGAETLPKFGAFLLITSLSNAPAIGRGAYLN